MIKVLTKIIIIFTMGFFLVSPGHVFAEANTVRDCDPTLSDSNLFLGMPHWYEYLKKGKQLQESNGAVVSTCTPQLTEDGDGVLSIGDIWLIALAVVGILLRLAGIAAFFMVLFGGFKYITSQGNSDDTKSARQTIINAFIGIVITIIASVSVSFGVKLLQK